MGKEYYVLFTMELIIGEDCPVIGYSGIVVKTAVCLVTVGLIIGEDCYLIGYSGIGYRAALSRNRWNSGINNSSI